MRTRAPWFSGGRPGAAARLGGLLALAGLVALVALNRPAHPPPPELNGRPESCLACHAGMTGFAPAHDPRALGCAVCHLGHPEKTDAADAHADMTRTPGNLSIVRRTCATGSCHAAIGDRVRNALMNTMSGVVAVDKHVFGENPDLDRPFVVGQLGHSPADTHLRTLCASCHLGADKTAPGPIDESSRGGGCSACHLDYGPRAREELERRGRSGLQALEPRAHPAISLQIPDLACFGCHSRSGRIATNYEGWHETLLGEAAIRASAPGSTVHRILPDGRVFEPMPADVHFQKGLACLDCHLAAEVMGDGAAHPHEEAAVKIACIDCHEDRPPAGRTLEQLDPETRLIATLRGLAAPGRRHILTRDGSAAYPNVLIDDAGVTRVTLRRSGNVLQPKPRTAACARPGTAHAALSCNACHSAWTSQCVSCHTQADPGAPAWDHLAGRSVSGGWRETAGQFFADPPTLGVTIGTAADGRTTQRQVITVAPGMILTLNQSVAAERAPDAFHRLFAPVSPHTTVSRARTCQSCHAEPSALGYGRGTLRYDADGPTGRWHFTPELAPLPVDGLPADAWIGFLRERGGEVATRKNLRPFSVEEQRRILRVGACLTCHAGDSAVMRQALTDFAGVLDRRSVRCAPPE